MIIPVFFVIHWYLSIFLQSFFHHRYAAHNHVTMSTNSERVFFICCFLTHGSSYMSPYAYGIMHRIHHIHTDTSGDPHSPHDEPNFFKLMFKTRNNYQKIYTSAIIFNENLTKNLPEWNAFEKMAHNWFTRSVWIFAYSSFYFYFSTSEWMYLLLPLTITMAAFQGTTINWWAHSFGYRNFHLNNTFKNMLPIDILFIGDAYHNNHHRYPGKTKNSYRWFETDIIYYIINLMHKSKIVRWKNS